MGEELINKVAGSALKQLDLETLYPKQEIRVFDLQSYLFMGLILKEKDFRGAMQQVSWQEYSNKVVAVTCSADAVIPAWAYMLVTSYLQPFAGHRFYIFSHL